MSLFNWLVVIPDAISQCIFTAARRNVSGKLMTNLLLHKSKSAFKCFSEKQKMKRIDFEIGICFPLILDFTIHFCVLDLVSGELPLQL